MDVKEFVGDVDKIVGVCEEVKQEVIEKTKRLWEETFDQPYEKAGASVAQPVTNEPPFYWDITNADVNTKYKSMAPRFLIEVGLSFSTITRQNFNNIITLMQ